MLGAYAYTPVIWPPLVAAVFLAAIGHYTWRRRNVPGGKPFLAMSVLSILVLLAMAFEAAAVAPATEITWQKVQFVLLMAGILAVACLVLDYAYPGRWLTRRNLLLLVIPFLLGLLLAAVNDSQLLWRLLEVGAGGEAALHFGPAGAILIACAVAIVVFNAAVLLHVFIRSPQHRWPVALMLAGQVGTRVLFLLGTPHLNRFSVVEILVPWTAYAIALFGFRILDPLPRARRTVIEQMQAGVIVFDAVWRVVNLNPFAETILGISLRAARGKTWQQLVSSIGPLPALPDSSPGRSNPPANVPEMTFGGRGRRHSEARSYAPTLSELRDFRSLLMGHVLMLRDVTEERRAQAQVLEQQRSLAMLRERELLARELHDGIGQVLAFACLKLAATRRLIADDKVTKADEQLAHLERVMVEAHAEVREQILDLRTAPTGEKPFFAALQQYVDGYRQNYGIQVGVSIGAGVDDNVLPSEAQVQLFRILQESFSNARKHAQTDCVRVSFELERKLLHMRVEDDGQGFDPRQQAGAGRAHFGLRFMTERAEQLHGSLRVISAPGQGTCVEVTVPVRDGAERGLSDARADCG